MRIQNRFYALELDDKTGRILSFRNSKREFLLKSTALFQIQLLGEGARYTRLCSDAAAKVKWERDKEENFQIRFEKVDGAELDAVVSVRAPAGQPFVFFSLAIDNRTGDLVEWIDFPRLIVPDDLVGNGGKSRLFWPGMEGCVIENASLRSGDWIGYKEIGVQSTGYSGTYPGPCTMQFLSYYSEDGGMYFAAHDPDSNLKSVEFNKEDDGIRLEFKLLPGTADRHIRYSYDMVLGVCGDSWESAAEIYRDFVEQSGMPLPPKLRDNPRIPEWMEESPVVILYPVRGTHDTGDMTPNLYFPYENAEPYLDRLAEELDSKIMALPMHWEGTAPWAPPYVWPPFGGEALFRKFVEDLHRKGHLVGVYCSGIGWTVHSYLHPEYETEQRYRKDRMEETICRTPDGSIVQSKIIGYPIRDGYDMCPENPKVAEIVSDEIRKIADAGVDYAQYFDQNLGGNSCLCYGRDHGHPPVPGKWQGDAMIRIFEETRRKLDAVGSRMVIGCELAAAEPFIRYLPFNDLRYQINFFYGKPVPAYAFVFHEYINNFMGNQNCISAAVNHAENPDNLLYRVAYSFAAGDMLTVVLGDQGNILWDWGCSWDVPLPDQEKVKTLIRNLNAMRRGPGRDYLRRGRMQQPYPVLGTKDFPFRLKKEWKDWVHHFPSVLSSRWTLEDGREGQILVNYFDCEQTVSVQAGGREIYRVDRSGNECLCTEGRIRIPPLDSVLVIF